MQTAIGVDLGGSHVTAAVITEDGAIHRQHEEDLEDLRFEAVIAAIDAQVGLALRDAGNVVGIGIGSPGNIDASSGAVLYSPNFGWQNAPLGEALRKKFSVPVFVANDARCATLGEYTFGMGRQTQKTLCCSRSARESAAASSLTASCCSATAGARARSDTTKFDRPMVSFAPAERSDASRRRLRARG